jgi:hypothetical protein
VTSGSKRGEEQIMYTIPKAMYNKIESNTIVNFGVMKNLKGRKVETKGILIETNNDVAKFLCNDGEFVIEAKIV